MAMQLFIDKTKRADRPRPSKRVPLRIRFKVSGRDEYGFTFEDYVETIDISAGGGCLIFKKDVKKGDNLKLYSPKGTPFLINVRWFRYDMRKNMRYLGFQLKEPLGRWVLA
jgi:PilZ domain